jgi:hypothetical protein
VFFFPPHSPLSLGWRKRAPQFQPQEQQVHSYSTSAMKGPTRSLVGLLKIPSPTISCPYLVTSSMKVSNIGFWSEPFSLIYIIGLNKKAAMWKYCVLLVYLYGIAFRMSIIILVHKVTLFSMNSLLKYSPVLQICVFFYVHLPYSRF